MNRPPMRSRSALTIVAILLCSTDSVAHAQAVTQNTVTKYEYDAMGNVTKITNALNAASVQTYDPLGRLTSQTDPDNQVTQYRYDGQGRLIQVTDARQLATLYTLDGLGNQLSLVSPDTGTTTTTVDSAGNILTRTDAKGQLTTYAYDVLNRLIRMTYSDGNVVNYTYDQGPNGLGRLSQISDGNSTIVYGYDQRGHLTSDTRTITVNTSPVVRTTRYQYDSAGHLSGMIYPSGRSLLYTLDSLGRITQIDSRYDNRVSTLVSQVRYLPFGGVQSYLNGAGQAYTRSYDLDGRITSYTLNNQPRPLGYDAAGRITSLADVNQVATTLTYDNLDRLTGVLTPGDSRSYAYDATGNRIAQTSGGHSRTLSYAADSHRLIQISGTPARSYSTDLNGSITHNGSSEFGYDARGRMVSALTASGLVRYTLNALGQRIQKSGPAGSMLFDYDSGGKLIAESSGNVSTEYVYLGDIPVALLVR